MLSRVADSIYWMGRYLERAEHTARVIDVHLNLMLDPSPRTSWLLWDRVAAALRATVVDPEKADAFAYARALSFDAKNPDSILSCVAAARENARQVRELIGSEMWEQQNRLYFQVRRAASENIFEGQPQEFFQSVKEGVQLFVGITDATLGRGEAYHFLEVGRHIERAGSTAAIVDVYLGDLASIADPVANPADPLDWIGLLRCCTAFEAYCKVYTADLRAARIAEFLLLNAEFPRSARYAVDRVQACLQTIGEETDNRRAVRLNHLAGRLRAALDYAQIDEIVVRGLRGFLEDIQTQCAEIHDALHQYYIVYAIDAALE